MASTSDRGAVTAELMLSIPGLLILFASCLGLINSGLESISLEYDAMQHARLAAYGLPLEPTPGESIETFMNGDKKCIKVTRESLFNLETSFCILVAGS